MKAMASHPDSMVYERLETTIQSSALLFLSALIIFSLFLFESSALAQSPRNADPQIPSMGSGTANSSPTIGGSGFKVPIPEIRMNRIIGETPPKKAPAEIKRGPVSSPVESQHVQPLHPADPKEQMERPGPIPMRLPFDSRYRKLETGPVQSIPSVKEEIVQEPEVNQTIPETTERPTLRITPPKNIDRQSEPISEQQAPPTPKEQIPAIEKTQPKPMERPRPEPHSPPFREPISPINITDSLPEPTKEIIAKRMIPLPHIVEVEAAKDTIKGLPVETLSISQYKFDPEALQFDTRRSPLVVEIEEPQTLRQPKEEPSSSGKPREAVEVTTPMPVYEPMTPPDSGQGMTVIAPKEPKPVIDTKPEKEAPMPPIESSPQVEQPEVRHKERIPSPLDDDSTMTAELKRYLKETAPILEELSLLMARTPSLSIADFDPSDIQAKNLPKEINLKMESMKRDLRILDSKIFSIIPPPAYSQYHDLIRQSINHTYLATEAFINFANESRVEDLNQVREHLAKAKEFIHRTVD